MPENLHALCRLKKRPRKTTQKQASQLMTPHALSAAPRISMDRSLLVHPGDGAKAGVEGHAEEAEGRHRKARRGSCSPSQLLALALARARALWRRG
eukprot:CAMPEP_0183461876 /NCGR_PEP_ID=MMETSP0370-20130417/140540_1 /TAXON_ID=268820 /ORGANISM="Peridinium aciculiferum, Strain PAER-2" /LENGTH=95 /DNA_ID=CAMNT_0025653865 /DNA_START=60 /DNA_END=345 /DNA_ORIENTATION=+